MPDPDPYARRSEKGDGNGKGREGERGKEGEPWHWRTKQRKMMKAEMDDAFRLRGSVMVLMVVVGVASAVLAGFGVKMGIEMLVRLWGR